MTDCTHEVSNFNPTDAVTINAGNVMYSAEEAAIAIDDFIALLESAKSEGATHTVFLSGNYRGAQYVSIDHFYNWLEEVY